MRITLNLASKPFIELRPLYARMRWWMVLLVLLTIPLALLLRVEQRRARDARAELTGLESTIHELQQEQAAYRVQMRLPQNSAVLEQSEFLNQLFKRKAFSWTAVMMDLETVLPSGVQVMNLEPITASDGQVTIRIRVNGQRDRAVELIRNLERSHRFLIPRLAAETAETAGGGSQSVMQPVSETSGVSFDILADYNPLPRPEARVKIAGDAAKSPTTPERNRSGQMGGKR